MELDCLTLFYYFSTKIYALRFLNFGLDGIMDLAGLVSGMQVIWPCITQS
jgi:hypothetical protein